MGLLTVPYSMARCASILKFLCNTFTPFHTLPILSFRRMLQRSFSLRGLISQQASNPLLDASDHPQQQPEIGPRGIKLARRDGNHSTKRLQFYGKKMDPPSLSQQTASVAYILRHAACGMLSSPALPRRRNSCTSYDQFEALYQDNDSLLGAQRHQPRQLVSFRPSRHTRTSFAG